MCILIQHEKGLEVRQMKLIQHEKGLALSILIQHKKGIALRHVELIQHEKGLELSVTATLVSFNKIMVHRGYSSELRQKSGMPGY
jgi:hypothetical protein